MAVVAVIAAGDMRRVLACCSDAIMAGATAANDLGMVNNDDRRKHSRAMAVFANVRRLHVSRIFANRFRAVMTVHAIGRYQAVIERRRQPASSGMTIITGIAARDM